MSVDLKKKIYWFIWEREIGRDRGREGQSQADHVLSMELTRGSISQLWDHDQSRDQELDA